MITHAEVLELYDYKDGELYWKKSTNNKVKIGSKAGGNSINSDGRKSISVNKKRYLSSRIIFLHQKGYLPNMIDHVNGIKTDNRIENLRSATSFTNNQNAKVRKDNNSGVKGVSLKNGKWYVQLKVNGVKKSFGYFKDLELADLVAQEARNKYHGEFACHN
jgi:hypothetical protein